jgi:hypothetical protein
VVVALIPPLDLNYLAAGFAVLGLPMVDLHRCSA